MNKKNLKVLLSSISVVIILVLAFVFGGMDLVNELFNQDEYIYEDYIIDNSENGNIIINDMLKIHYIDVGQGDSILLQNEDKTILIDGGTRASKDKLLNYLTENGIETLNYVIATHPHEDHIGSLDDAINNFNVEHVLMPKKSASTKVFSDLVEAIKNKGLKAEQLEVGTEINLADMKITILAPVKDDYKETNDVSVGIKVDYKDNSFIFTGDVEEVAEKDIIDTGLNLKANVFKANHHASTTSNSKEFIEKVNPTYAIIQVGEGNSYGHPHTEILELFQQNNITVYRTDRNGNIVLTTDGKTIDFEVEKGSKTGYTDTNKETNIE